LSHRLNGDALDVIFRKARTFNAWQDKLVSDEILRELCELMKWGPTSANASPARLLLLRSNSAKERLRLALSPSNVEKTMSAPVTVIVAYDLRFYEKLPKLAPHSPGFRDLFANNPDLADSTQTKLHATRRVFHHRGSRTPFGLWSDVRIRKRHSRIFIFRWARGKAFNESLAVIELPKGTVSNRA